MVRSFARPGSTALLLAFVAAACGRSGGLPAGAGTPAPAAPAEAVSAGSSGATSPDSALEALYRARTDSATAKFSEADVTFMTGMIHHHAQALVMAEMAPSHGASPSVATLCARILNSQRDEIATMQRWLRDRGRPAPEVHITGTRLMIHMPGMDHDMPPMQMAGMLSDEQMAELDAARGTEFDRLFLKYMIQHHSGALTMVQDLFASPGAAQEGWTFKLASDIQVDQKTEIARMRKMLDALESGAAGH